MFDVVVIGGGATGAGSALDAATRGLNVALVEARDFASGTSSRSSKLVHGGLRYLEQRNFGLVREALRERGLLLNVLAPHLVTPVPFLLPLTEHWQRAYIGAGLVLYDTLGGHEGLPRHRHLTKRGALRIAPALKTDALVGAIQYYDAKVDDARHTMTVARTAAEFGAAVASNARVVGFLREGERVTGVRVRDEAGGDEFEVRAREVVNATGVWTDDLQHLVGERGKFKVRASKGIHLVVPKDRMQLDTGLILRTEKSVLFVIPWGRHWIVGTTDTDWELDKAHPAASSTDIDYVLEHVNAVLDAAAHARGRRRRLRRAAAAADGRVREHVQAVARAHRRRAGARAGRRRGRQVHDLPRDGARRDRRRRPRAGPHGPAVGHPRHAAGRRATASRRCGTGATGSPRPPACTSRGSSTSCAATARAPRSCSR